MMFQSYALFPHMSVAKNVAYGLKRLPLDKAEKTRRVEEALGMLQLAHLANASRISSRAASGSAWPWRGR
ncbi:MAG: hypothetical protein WDN69_16150 [Aliidongia sp.]